jgi:hypothetical protein
MVPQSVPIGVLISVRGAAEWARACHGDRSYRGRSDRWRASAIAAEIETARYWRGRKDYRLLDAEDLTIGYRTDVAIP